MVDVDYAKAGPRDLCMDITVTNAGPAAATLHLLPTLWFRNTWSWGYTDHPKPSMRLGAGRIIADHSRSGPLVLVGEGDPEALFCENETNAERLFGVGGVSPYPKDGINDHLIAGAPTVNPEHHGTKAALHYEVTVRAGESKRIRVRLVGVPHPALDADPSEVSRVPIDLGDEFDAVLAARRTEADAFYDAVIPADREGEEYRIARQAFAGLLWSKQFYHYDVSRWLAGDPGQPTPPPGRGDVRNGRLAAPEQPRRDLDAGPLGVPVVRRLGPRLPLRHPRPHRRRSSPNSNWSCCCGSGTCIPTGSCRRMSGTSPT